LRLGDEIIFENRQGISDSAHRPRSFYASFITIAVAMLMLKVLASIVWEYRFYFPPNFDAAFLIGREKTFVGIYRIAFYTHILAGPVVVILSAALMLTGGKSRFRKFHRWVGRLLVVMVLVSIVPSGFVMSQYALSGPVAGIGFALQTFATATASVAAIQFARAKMFALHQRWAIRCFILLCSPLVFRVVGGTLVVFDLESSLAYTLNAWLSWLVPLGVFEVLRRIDAPQLIPHVVDVRAKS
jgi:uncharacterized membrane protein